MSHAITAVGFNLLTQLQKGPHVIHIRTYLDDYTFYFLGDFLSCRSVWQRRDTSRWRHLWRSAPLNLDLSDRTAIPRARVSGILSSHPGPGRRLSVPRRFLDNDAHPAATLDAWLRSRALDGLQELHFDYSSTWPPRPRSPPLPESAHRFSSTLRIASFGGCAFPDDNRLRLPLLKQLSLKRVEISETSLYALLAGCPLLQSLMVSRSIGCSRIRIVSPTLRSIAVNLRERGGIMFDHLIIEDAPLLERLLLLEPEYWASDQHIVISVISAPKLKILGQLPLVNSVLKFGTSIVKGSYVVNSTMVLPSVKVLALTHAQLSLDEVIAFMKCFPNLENLYIKMSTSFCELRNTVVTNAWRQKYRNIIDSIDIHLKKIVLKTYRGNRSHVNFAEFFVLNARVLQSMVLEVDYSNYSKEGWIERQQKLLKIEDRASRGVRFDFVSQFGRPVSLDHIWYEQAHDLSTADPFVGFDEWAIG